MKASTFTTMLTMLPFVNLHPVVMHGSREFNEVASFNTRALAQGRSCVNDITAMQCSAWLRVGPRHEPGAQMGTAVRPFLGGL